MRSAVPSAEYERRERWLARLRLAAEVAVETVGLLFIMGCALLAILLLAAAFAPDATPHIGVMG